MVLSSFQVSAWCRDCKCRVVDSFEEHCSLSCMYPSVSPLFTLAIDDTTFDNVTTTPNKQHNNTKLVTLPSGVHSGDIIHVRAPDGRLNAITVPNGMGPGSTFTVEFSDDTPPPPAEEDLTPGVYVPTVMAEPEVMETSSSSNAAYVPGANGDVVASATTGPYVPAYK